MYVCMYVYMYVCMYVCMYRVFLLILIAHNHSTCSGCSRGKSDFLVILFQLKIGLNKEFPALSLGLGWDNIHDLKQWGVCRSAMKGISNSTLKTVYMSKIQQHLIHGRSTFAANLQRALGVALGGRIYVQCDALSLCGYTFDFEVLLDGSGAPIGIPIEWQKRSPDIIASSIGVKIPATRNPGDVKMSEELVDSMKTTEEADKRSVGNFPAMKHESRAFINLASDWGLRFGDLLCPVARRLVIEGDGTRHYAQNCDHTLGSTVLKRKLLQLLGWEVLNVSSKVYRFVPECIATAHSVLTVIILFENNY